LDLTADPLVRGGRADKMAKKTKGRFGFHRGGDKHEPPTAAYAQIYVKSSTLSRAPDLAISGRLTVIELRTTMMATVS
jgi:hypothetical protein